MWFINRWIQPSVNIYKKDKKGNIRWPLTLLKEKKLKKVLASITNKLNAIHMFSKSWMPAERRYNHLTFFDMSVKASTTLYLLCQNYLECDISWLVSSIIAMTSITTTNTTKAFLQCKVVLNLEEEKQERFACDLGMLIRHWCSRTKKGFMFLSL